MGGVAPIPKLLSETGEYLVGKSVSAETVLGAVAVTQREISPISDIRGTATYKRLLARQLILAHFARLYPEHIRLQELYEAR
jgi:xanthine dehydrogenase small subunit